MEPRPTTASTNSSGQVVRTTYLIYPRFQMALVLANAVVVFGFFAIVMLSLRSSLVEMQQTGAAAGLAEGHVYYQFLQMQAQRILVHVLMAMVVALLLSSIFFIWFSHRLVGPLVGLIRYLENAREARAQGRKLNPVKFRKGDFFHELADGVNGVLDVDSADAVKKGSL